MTFSELVTRIRSKHINSSKLELCFPFINHFKLMSVKHPVMMSRGNRNVTVWALLGTDLLQITIK